MWEHLIRQPDHVARINLVLIQSHGRVTRPEDYKQGHL